MALDSNKVDKAWEKAGVRCVTNYFLTNDYYVNGKKVSRIEALEYVNAKYGKVLNVHTYDISDTAN